MHPIILEKSGIYKIENKITGDFYIGQASKLIKRKYDHWYRLSKHYHGNPHLQNAWDKYGKGNFEFVPILVCEQEELTYYEQKCVNILKPHYNIRLECIDSNIGIKFSEETRKNMSRAKTGQTLSKESREKLSKSLMGKHKITEEGRKRLSEYHKNLPEETRIKLAAAGRNISDETRRKRRESLAITNSLPETKEKRSAVWKGRHHSEESKKKMSISGKRKNSRHLSEEEKHKISLAITEWHRKRRENGV
jgi:group I intron endonuclease